MDILSAFDDTKFNELDAIHVFGNMELILKQLLNLVFVFLVLVINPLIAQAYQVALIQSNVAFMRKDGSDTSPVIQKLNQGTRVNTSDQSTGGYYRVSTSNASGWVRESDLVFIANANGIQNSRPLKKWSISLIGGLDSWTPSDVNNLTQSNSLNGGAGYGIEITYSFNRKWSALVRLERLSKSATGTGPNNTALSVTLASTPILFGAQYHLLEKGPLFINLSALVGLGFGTSLSVDENQAGNPTKYSATPFTGLINAEAGYSIGKVVSVFIEPGYRFLKTSSINPGSVGSTTTYLQDTNGNYSPVALNLSGFVMNAGLRFSF